MCNIGGGANRCDAHWGESQKAADLAKRRAKYAALKGGTVRQYTHKTGDKPIMLTVLSEESSLHPLKPRVNLDQDIFTKKIETMEGNPYTQGDTSEQNELGFTKTYFTGDLIDVNYISSFQTEGIINWEKLDKDSYKEFGFQEISEKRVITKELLIETSNLSELELGNLDKDEETVLNKYTSEDFQWINTALYNENKEGDQVKEVVATPHLDPSHDFIFLHQDDWKDQTAGLLKLMTDKLDSIVEKKSHHQQRVLYRGLKAATGSVKLAGGVERYVKKNFQLGKEIVFDGYQSASLAPTVALEYAAAQSSIKNNRGVVFEISTPSGVNIVSQSSYTSEQEVILPRNSRYMVVGVHENTNYSAVKEGVNDAYDSEHDCEGVYVVQLVEITETGKISSFNDRPASPPPLTEKQTNERKETKLLFS